MDEENKLIRITSKTCKACAIQMEIMRRIMPQFPDIEICDLDRDEDEDRVKEYDIHGVPFLKLGSATLTGAHTLDQTKAFLCGELSDDIIEAGIENPHYLDNAATTPVCQEAVTAAVSAMTDEYGNPSSTHYKGRQAKRLLTASRRIVAESINADVKEIYFTSCGSESDNWAIIQGAHMMSDKGKHIISSTVEHDAVRKSLLRLEEEGYEITRLVPDAVGRISVDKVKAVLRPDTILVSLMLVNNETGAVNDIAGIAQLLKSEDSGAVLHTDAVQGYMKLPIDAKELGADIISISGHKIHAPKGIGALYIRSGIELPPYIIGGAQEFGIRAGTENLPLIAAMAAAVKAYSEDADSVARIKSYKEQILERIKENIPAIEYVEGDAPHIVNISIPVFRSEVVINYLSDRGIYVSNSSACKRGAKSHVLAEIGKSDEYIDGAIRISLSRMTTQKDVDVLCEALIALNKFESGWRYD